MNRICLVLLALSVFAAPILATPPPHAGNPQILNAVEQISADSILADITRLTQFQTRHTFSDTTSDSVGIGAALRWVRSKAAAYDTAGHFSYEFFPWSGDFQGDTYTRHILIARASGTSGDGARYIIGGHIDSRTVNINDNTGIAPGADDNGSSSAALIEMLRLTQMPIAHDLELIWFTGEEQGLWGSAAYAQFLSQQGARVDGMVAMDMISHIALPSGAIDTVSFRLYAQGDPGQGGTASVSRSFQRYLKWVGEAYADIDSFDMHIFAASDRPGRGSDHLSFSGEGYPAVRVIERNEDTGFQHNPNDTPAHLSPPYARRIARATYGALLTMLQAPARPPSPVVEQTSPTSMEITIPDSIVLPAGGRFYLAARGWYDSYYIDIVDLGFDRTYDYTVISGQQYAFAISRADSADLPSPFSTETVVDALAAHTRDAIIPEATRLTAAPNPFNSEVIFDVELTASGPVALDIFDLLGRHVATVLNESLVPGSHRAAWTPANLSTGIYLARLTTADKIDILKIAYLR
jgi:hypothetical protein